MGSSASSSIDIERGVGQIGFLLCKGRDVVGVQLGTRASCRTASTQTGMNFDTGTWLPSAWWSSSTSGLHSGK